MFLEWLALYNVNIQAWHLWANTLQKNDPTPQEHGLVARFGSQANANGEEANQHVRKYTESVSAAERHPFPIRHRDAEGTARFTFE
eukprot:IDg17587t1